MNTNFLAPPPPYTRGKHRIPLTERFWGKVTKTDNCWIWQGAKLPFGHGVLGDRRNGHYVSIKAHRLSWEIHYGVIPAGKCVLHHCDNPPCVRPDHLFIGTDKDNSDDCIRKGRAVFPTIKRGSQVTSSKLTESDIPEIRGLIARGLGLQNIGDRFGVNKKIIWNIKHGFSWTHV